jgi:phosphatidylglycerol:prolipoprotein diacylglycerol transferase
LFLALYAAARIAGECFRQPDPQIGYLWLGTTEGQLLSIPVLITGIVVILWARRRPPPTAP